MFRFLCAVVMRTWLALVWASTVLGVILLWPTLLATPEQFGSTWTAWVLCLPTREHIAWIFLAVSIGWIIWMDLRPYWRAQQAMKQALLVVAAVEILMDNRHYPYGTQNSMNVDVVEIDSRDTRRATVQFGRDVDVKSIIVEAQSLPVDATSETFGVEIVDKAPRRVRLLFNDPVLETLGDHYIKLTFRAMEP